MTSIELAHQIIQTPNCCYTPTPKIHKNAFLLEVTCKSFFLVTLCWYSLEALFLPMVPGVLLFSGLLSFVQFTALLSVTEGDFIILSLLKYFS